MIDPRLTPLHQVLSRKADAVQREFGAVGDALQALGRTLVNTPSGDTGPLRAEQAALRERQMALAADINVWRDRARAVLRQHDEPALQAFLDELEAAGDEDVKAAALAAREPAAVVRAKTGSLAAASAGGGWPATLSPARRLIERARHEPDLRGDDAARRQREAVEFANRPGLAQSDEALTDLEAVLDDPDPMVREVITLTLIQCHRFRALRLGDLELAHASVRRLARFKHRAVLPVLIEILENPRSGFVAGEGGMVEGTNRRSRLVALAALVEWRTATAQAAIRARRFDREPQMAEAAERALAVFPGDWG